MVSRSRHWLLLAALITPCLAAEPPAFDAEVRPILADHCFKCHGFDKRRRFMGLRLDTREGALAELDSGHRAVVPGDPEASEMMQRIAATDDRRMPPAAEAKQLSTEQIETLRQWIAAGAEYQPHWSFQPVVRPELPEVSDPEWVRNPIDRFVVARLDAAGLQPSLEADRRTLIRRVTLDLTGLPPSRDEVAAFLADDSPEAYEKVVNRLLASPHYGERMALAWLDLARYADTNGYHIDNERYMWPWRDWVIRAYNGNLPFDQFVIQQLAGDLLPNPTRDDWIATGFNRNHPVNFEGGAIDEEYQTAYVMDRVNTTATTFMGLTINCATCHDHKYDPITNEEYYQFFAYFNNIAEKGLDGREGNSAPTIQVPTDAQELARTALDWRLKGSQERLAEHRGQAAAKAEAWASTHPTSPGVDDGLLVHHPLDQLESLAETTLDGEGAFEAGKIGQAIKLEGKGHLVLGDRAGFERTDGFSYGAWVKPAGDGGMAVLARMDDADGIRGYDLYLSGDNVFCHIIHTWPENAIRVMTKGGLKKDEWNHVFVTYDGSSKGAGVTIYINGKAMGVDVSHDTLTDTIKVDKPLHIGRRNPAAPFNGLLDDVRMYDRRLEGFEVAALAGFPDVEPLLAKPWAELSDESRSKLTEHYLRTADAEYRALAAERDEHQRQFDELNKQIPTTMVMRERTEPRETRLLKRGQYDQPGKKVKPGVPEILPPLPDGAPNNRLGLAEWLVDPSHPLTSRVAVNRYWQMYFGRGLVGTTEDFGTQGDRPTHPELLDWLAAEFEDGWDVKAMQRRIVCSATYRQSSRATPELRERDPQNRLLARGPRFRMPAEFIRDQALTAAGLLNDTIGGPSVKPYQPPGLWADVAYNAKQFTAQVFEQDHGADLYRRSLYIFWKRSSPPPTMQTFDAPEREYCTVRRSVTNTPLQALALLNDPTYVEAARKLAERAIEAVGHDPAKQVAWCFEQLTCRPPTAAEAAILERQWAAQEAKFQAAPEQAEALLKVGESPVAEGLDQAALASLATVASVILNLDETVTKG